jgi:hypothetical protein
MRNLFSTISSLVAHRPPVRLVMIPGHSWPPGKFVVGLGVGAVLLSDRVQTQLRAGAHSVAELLFAVRTAQSDGQGVTVAKEG